MAIPSSDERMGGVVDGVMQVSGPVLADAVAGAPTIAFASKLQRLLRSLGLAG